MMINRHDLLPVIYNLGQEEQGPEYILSHSFKRKETIKKL